MLAFMMKPDGGWIEKCLPQVAHIRGTSSKSMPTPDRNSLVVVEVKTWPGSCSNASWRYGPCSHASCRRDE